MLHLIYVLAFTVIAFLAISNLIQNLITLNSDARKLSSQRGGRSSMTPQSSRSGARGRTKVPHPELLDEEGRPVNEPLLVMRSVSVEEARQQLDQLYDASPSNPGDPEES